MRSERRRGTTLDLELLLRYIGEAAIARKAPNGGVNVHFLMEISFLLVRVNVQGIGIASTMEQIILGMKTGEKSVFEWALKVFVAVCRKVLP